MNAQRNRMREHMQEALFRATHGNCDGDEAFTESGKLRTGPLQTAATQPGGIAKS